MAAGGFVKEVLGVLDVAQILTSCALPLARTTNYLRGGSGYLAGAASRQ